MEYGSKRIEMLRELYKEGTIVIATHTEKNRYFVPAGTKGKVIKVTDSGMISVKWEQGGNHVLLPDIDSFEIVN